jgi:glc operon protein GlcG
MADQRLQCHFFYPSSTGTCTKAYNDFLNLIDETRVLAAKHINQKAYSAVAFRRPTKVFQDLVGQGGPNLCLLRLSGASVLEGGIPIVVDGKIIGGIGVSGVTSEQDAQIAQAGIEALK